MAESEAAGSSPADNKITEAAVDQTTAAEPVAPVDATPDANAAPSSTADTKTEAADAKDQRSADLDLTLAALGKKADKAENSSTSDADKGDKTATAEAKTDKDGDTAEAEDPDKKVPFHDHPRWKEVTSENKSLKEQVSTLTANVEEFNAIEAFRTSNNLEPVEVADGYKIMALLKNDPGKALPYLEGLVSDIRTATGMTLPADLLEDVDAGAITEERALELSRARAQSASAESREAARRAAEAENQKTQRVEAFRNAGEEWSTQMKSRDPEFAEKEPMVAERINAIIRSDPSATPRTPGEVAKLADRALADVNKRLSGMGRRSTPPAASGVSAPAGPARSGPMTPLEITQAALAQTG